MAVPDPQGMQIALAAAAAQRHPVQTTGCTPDLEGHHSLNDWLSHADLTIPARMMAGALLDAIERSAGPLPPGTGAVRPS
ncbi:hypothetical protein [Streptomyces sp. NPDC086835]|uniref:hypothetical protein n=1 Tax=Streptomyces sp. NPDC086835 TaxID=3365761 RepID=UPI00382E46FF